MQSPASLADFLTAQTVITSLPATSKTQLLSELATIAGPMVRRDPVKIFRALIDREEITPSGLGMGAAMTSARFRGLRSPFALFARLARPLEYDAYDERPVDIVVMLLGPEPASRPYLDVLISASRALKDAGVRNRLRATSDPQSICEAFRA